MVDSRRLRERGDGAREDDKKAGHGNRPSKILDGARSEFDEEKRHQRDALSGVAFDGSRLEVDVDREL